jgi:hypothetical protein
VQCCRLKFVHTLRHNPGCHLSCNSMSLQLRRLLRMVHHRQRMVPRHPHMELLLLLRTPMGHHPLAMQTRTVSPKHLPCTCVYRVLLLPSPPA